MLAQTAQVYLTEPAPAPQCTCSYVCSVPQGPAPYPSCEEGQEGLSPLAS